MVSILPVLDHNIINRYNDLANLNCTHAYHIVENNDVLGYSLYDISDDAVYINFIVVFDNDILLFDGLVRAILSAVNTNGINKAYFNDKLDFPTLNTLQIVENSVDYIESIDAFFSKGCKK